MQKLNLKLTLRFLYIGFKGLALHRKGRSNLFEFIVMLEDFDDQLNFSRFSSQTPQFAIFQNLQRKCNLCLKKMKLYQFLHQGQNLQRKCPIVYFLTGTSLSNFCSGNVKSLFFKQGPPLSIFAKIGGISFRLLQLLYVQKIPEDIPVLAHSRLHGFKKQLFVLLISLKYKT